MCTPCSTTCAEDEYQSTACSTTADRICSSCTTCTEDQWQQTDCQANGVVSQNRVCPPCTTTCPSNQYETTACTSTADRIGGACTTCTSTEWQSTACQAEANVTQNRVCEACTVCEATDTGGQYETLACGINLDAQCADCRVCETNEYETIECQASGVAGTNRGCAYCAASVTSCGCYGGTCFEAGAILTCNGCEEDTYLTDANTCTECVVPECPLDEYEEIPCGGTTDRICSACVGTVDQCVNYLSPRVCFEKQNQKTCSLCAEGYFLNAVDNTCNKEVVFEEELQDNI